MSFQKDIRTLCRATLFVFGVDHALANAGDTRVGAPCLENGNNPLHVKARPGELGNRRAAGLILLIPLAAVLLAGCAADSGLWGAPFTPTPPASATPAPPTITSIPSLTPTASITPLKVLPMPGSPTPGLAPTQPPPPTALPLPLTETPIPSPSATLPPVNPAGPMDVYISQGGDTLAILAKRFRLQVEQFISNNILPPPDQLIPPGTLLIIPKPDPAEIVSPADRTIPDSEVVMGPSTIGFSTMDFVLQQGGYLSTFSEYVLSGGELTGYQAVERIAQENSLNPRIILAIIEYESHWVLGQPTNLAQDEYPLGYVDFHYRKFFRQLMWAAGTLSDGYYRWRSGDLTEITLKDGTNLRLNPRLNAGTAAIQYYFAQTHTRAEWDQAVSPAGFPALYAEMFGDPWERAAVNEPTLPDGIAQPALTLPFEPGKVWAFSGGPHSAWEEKGAMAALDFAPAASEHGCVKSDVWVLAPAAGKVVRNAPGVVMLDLDGDGLEETGWVILFLHIATEGRVLTNQVLQKGDHIGHASCEGGVATGTHLHIARKYNGEWILADGPLPFNLDGWIAHNGPVPYKGSLTRGDITIQANTSGSFETRIIRDK